MNSQRSPFRVFSRILCFALALYFLNFSIDTRDANPDSIPEDLSINDIESVAEFLAEEVMEFQNAFEEHDERDADEGGMFDFSKEVFYSGMNRIEVEVPFQALVDTTFFIPSGPSLSFLSREVIAPPPRG